MPPGAFARQCGDPAKFQHLENAGDFQFIGNRERQNGKVRNGRFRLVSDKRHAGSAVGFDVIGKERALSAYWLVVNSPEYLVEK